MTPCDEIFYIGRQTESLDRRLGHDLNRISEPKWSMVYTPFSIVLGLSFIVPMLTSSLPVYDTSISPDLIMFTLFIYIRKTQIVTEIYKIIMMKWYMQPYQDIYEFSMERVIFDASVSKFPLNLFQFQFQFQFVCLIALQSSFPSLKYNKERETFTVHCCCIDVESSI